VTWYCVRCKRPIRASVGVYSPDHEPLHLSCAVVAQRGEPATIRRRVLDALSYLFPRDHAKQARAQAEQARQQVQAQVDAMPEPTVLQHPVGYVPEDEETK
jgi:hypothetical protein